jgi:hypothetical protein
LFQSGAPDIVDQNVQVTVLVPDLIGESHDLGGVEMVDDEGNAVTAKRGNDLRGLLDRFRSIVVGLQ